MEVCDVGSNTSQHISRHVGRSVDFFSKVVEDSKNHSRDQLRRGLAEDVARLDCKLAVGTFAVGISVVGALVISPSSVVLIPPSEPAQVIFFFVKNASVLDRLPSCCLGLICRRSTPTRGADTTAPSRSTGELFLKRDYTKSIILFSKPIPFRLSTETENTCGGFWI